MPLAVGFVARGVEGEGIGVGVAWTRGKAELAQRSARGREPDDPVRQSIEDIEPARRVAATTGSTAAIKSACVMMSTRSFSSMSLTSSSTTSSD